MRKHVLFIHGGGAGAYEADKKLAENLQGELGADYRVQYPRMPSEDRPEYELWKGRIAEELAALAGEVILVGHSLGASVLLKYLSEERLKKPVLALFLLATPYWGTVDWQVSEYALDEDFASRLPEGLPVFFYHSRDDAIVPFVHLDLFK
jgi:uncharacterized protein